LAHIYLSLYLQELACTNEEAYQVLKTIRGDAAAASPGSSSTTATTSTVTTTTTTKMANGQSALELLRREHGRKPIITFSESIDEMLGGGVALGKITEFCMPLPLCLCCAVVVSIG
jgi:hypothetical protein